MKASRRLIIAALLLALTTLDISSGQSVCDLNAECGFDLETSCINDPTTEDCVAQYLCYNVSIVNLNYCCATDKPDQCPHGGEDLAISDCSSVGCNTEYNCHFQDNVCCPAIECPPPATGSTGQCGDLCNTTSCKKGLMCCPTTCGQECKSPISTITGEALAPRWWLPPCFRSKVDQIKTYMNRLVDIFSICRFCFSIDIVRQMAALSDCLRQDDPLHALKTLALAIESAKTTTHIANAMIEVAGQINTTTGECEERGKITTLVEHINFYAVGIENGFFTCNVPKICKCHGDPHCTTFNGIKYTYAHEGSYYLLKQENFTVVAEFEICNARRHISCVKSVEITSISHGAKILLGRHGNLPIETPPYIFMSSRGEINIDNFPDPDKIVVRLANGAEITWDEEKEVEIFVPPDFVTKGMCGNNDGNPNNEFLGPDGTVLPNVNEFGQSWAVPLNEVPPPANGNPPPATEAPPSKAQMHEISFK